MNSLMTRWKGESLYVNGSVAKGGENDDVHIARKLEY